MLQYIAMDGKTDGHGLQTAGTCYSIVRSMDRRADTAYKLLLHATVECDGWIDGRTQPTNCCYMLQYSTMDG